MIDRLKDFFPHIEEKKCLESTILETFEIYDHPLDQRCYIDGLFDKEFEVINKNGDKIFFVAMDACLFSSTDGSRCDCIVFNKDTICFIELKKCKKKNLSTNQNSAEKQLKATLDFFHQHNLIKEKKIEAYICVNCRRTGNPLSSLPKVRGMEKVDIFLAKYKTKLIYSCQKVFT